MAILNVLLKNKVRCFANDNIADYLSAEQLDIVETEAAGKIQELLHILLIDTEQDHNTKESAARIAKMLVRETLIGRYTPLPKVTDFPNCKDLDQLYTVGPIAVRSMCSHHFMPIVGECFIGILPSDRVIGLSKFSRLVDWVMRRPQIQEEATVQIADLIDEIIFPKGVAVIVRASHGCMTHRGVKEHDTLMTTSVLRGAFKDTPSLKTEFLTLIPK